MSESSPRPRHLRSTCGSVCLGGAPRQSPKPRGLVATPFQKPTPRVQQAMATTSLPKREPVLLRDFAGAYPRALGLPHNCRFYVYNDKVGCAEDLLLPLRLTMSKTKRLAPEDTAAAAVHAFREACATTPGSEDWTVYLEGQDLDGRPGTIDRSCTVSTLRLRFSLAPIVAEHGLDALKDAVAALRFVPAKSGSDADERPLEPWVEDDADDVVDPAYFPGQLL